MKKLLLSLSVVAAILGCQPTPKTEAVAFTMPAVSDVAMYQVNPRVFAPQQSLQAVTARLDSISGLGVNVMWVMPIYPIGIEKGKNSPYCIRDYKAIAPEFGTIDDLKQLVKACHERGMGLILDWVANHTAWDHPWVKDHPDWYTHDATADTIIHPRPFDWYDVADLNYDSDSLRQAMIDAMTFWVTEVGVDGFRCDVADEVPADFWHEAIQKLRAAAGERHLLMLAEGRNLTNFTVGGFDMNYAWEFKDELIKVWKGAPVTDVIAVEKVEYDSLPAGKKKLRFTTNHDLATEEAPCVRYTNDRGAMAAYVASIFPRGGALVYSSQEVGYPEPINFFHYVPVDWKAKSDIWQEYKALIGLYNTHPALRSVELTTYPDRDVYMFEKQAGKEKILVLVNVRNAQSQVQLPKDWTDEDAVNLMTNEEIELGQTLTLEPYQYLILKD